MTGGLVTTVATGAAETTGRAETVATDELQIVTGAWYSILRMHDEDRGVALTMDSGVRILMAEAERGGFKVHPGGQKAGFCGRGLRDRLVPMVAFTGVIVRVSDTLRTEPGPAPARPGVGTSAKCMGLLAPDRVGPPLDVLRCNMPPLGDGDGRARSVMVMLPAVDMGLVKNGTWASTGIWEPFMALRSSLR